MKKITPIFLSIIYLTGCSNIPDLRNHDVKWQSDIKRDGDIVNLRFDPSQSHLSQDQKSDLQLQLSKFDALSKVHARVFVDANEFEALTPIQKTRLKKIKTFLTRKGINGKQVKSYRWKESRFGQMPDHTIIVVFDKNKIDPHKCPEWKSTINRDESPDGTPDFGCANAYNHAVLVADKSDLIEGKTLRNRDSTLKLNAINNYQKDKTKELKIIKSTTADNTSSN